MYDNYFGLKETPFTIAPDPRFLYMSERHREALAHLLYGFETDGGFVLLTGEVGTGKTTISRCLLEQLPDNSNVAVVLNPKVSARELLETICDELQIEYPQGNTSLKTFIDCINRYLLETNAQGKKTVVIVEEAQNLEMEVLEQLRLLTNLETNQRKLLQIIMIGQPELLLVLQRPELRQLEQRITARYHLLPLSRKDTIDYIKHRLAVAGLKEPLFSYSLLRKIYQYTGGIPRKINLLCDRAMLGAYVQNRKDIDRHILNRAAREVFGVPQSRRSGSGRTWSVAAVGTAVVTLLLIALGGYMVFDHRDKFARLAGTIKSYFSAEPVSEQPRDAVTLEQDSFLDILDGQTEANSRQHAYRDLFAQWNKSFAAASVVNPCDFAGTKGLGCLSKNGDLHDLRAIDRPAVLKFLNSIGDTVYATIVGMDDNQAILSVGGHRVVASLPDVESRWFGDYTALWQLPPDFNGVIRLGSNGPDVQWLASQLANISGRELSRNGMISYDAGLIKEVKNFQMQEGLETDGIAGAQTLIRLNSVLQKDVPRLTGSNTSPRSDKQSAGAIDSQSGQIVAQLSALKE
ncbi:MAG: AAA family ATPase [Gammaproteobacteria bacterium]|jgi:general secretion pathway protein A